MTKQTEDIQDSPTLWFVEMESAIRTSDRDREMRARRELARLGVLVTIDARSVLADSIVCERRESDK
jgi:hypothetical protein